jgi:biotin carboxylase
MSLPVALDPSTGDEIQPLRAVHARLIAMFESTPSPVRHGGKRPRVLLLIPTTTYRAEPFLDAAERVGADVLIGSNYCHVLADHYQSTGALILRFDEPEETVRKILAATQGGPLAAIVPVDDQATEIAAEAAGMLGLRHNAPAAAHAARDKAALRKALAQSRVATPHHQVYDLDLGPARAAREMAVAIGFPCVLKPRVLSASRGVIRADDATAFVIAWRRIAAILRTPELRAEARHDLALDSILVEQYVDGPEVALEAILHDGVLTPLALFDKPDPLTGPFFEETIYVTPSRLSAADQAVIADRAARAATAIGLREGPVHAERRLGAGGPWVIEVAARSIGGLCSRALRFGLGEVSLEELILRQALGQEIEAQRQRVDEAAGVMMLPIPRAGVLRGVRGEEGARAVPLVTDVAITIRPGEEVTPLPEGARYLGFVFARGKTPDAVEAALRAAAATLEFDIAPAAPIQLAPDSSPSSQPPVERIN